MAGANKIRALLAARQDKDRGDDVQPWVSSLLRGRQARPCHATMAAAAAAGRVLAGADVFCFGVI